MNVSRWKLLGWFWVGISFTGLGLWLLNSSKSRNRVEDAASTQIQESFSGPSIRAVRVQPVREGVPSSLTNSVEQRGNPSEPDQERFREPTWPTPKDLRNDVKKDPHAVPESLVRFTMELSDHLERALDNDAEAERFFDILEKCVTQSDSMPTTVRAVCLSQARYLASHRNGMQSRYDSLFARADASVKLLLN